MQCREITGPTPHSVALRERRPLLKPPEHLILERRQQEAAREQMLEFTRYQNTCSLRDKWEKTTDRRIMHGTIERRVQEALKQYKISIEDRRNRLQALLETEEKDLLEELESKQETLPDRQRKMRDRTRLLREQREEVRKRLVAEKLDQLFRDQSEELRIAQSRQLQDDVCTAWAYQLRSRQEVLSQKLEEERLFADLWEADRQAKEERETMEAQRQRCSNLQQQEFLLMQMDAANQQRVQARQLKEEQVQLLRQQQEVQRLEEQRQRSIKQQKQRCTHRALDHELRLKMRRLAQEQQKELDKDMHILEQLLQEQKDERSDRELRKRELQQEQNRYRQYLAEQAKEQRRLEEEVEQLREAELERAWARRQEQSRLQQVARDRLMMEVMETRRLQIQEKLDKNMQEQAQLAQEREELNKTIQEFQREEEEQKERRKQACQDFQTDLLSQISYKQRIHDRQKAELEHKFQQELTFANQYQNQLIRPNSHSGVIHSFRRIEGPDSLASATPRLV